LPNIARFFLCKISDPHKYQSITLQTTWNDTLCK